MYIIETHEPVTRSSSLHVILGLLLPFSNILLYLAETPTINKIKKKHTET